VDAFMAVHNYFGSGFWEIVYKDAIEHERLEEQVDFQMGKKFLLITKAKFCGINSVRIF
jgi:hypothetical protein